MYVFYIFDWYLKTEEQKEIWFVQLTANEKKMCHCNTRSDAKPTIFG